MTLDDFHEEVPAGQECVVCGSGAEGSVYWTPMLAENWAVVREFVAPRFRDADHVQNVLFNTALNKPYCGPECSNNQQETSDGT